MLDDSPEPGAKKWAIHDHQGFGGLSFSEWESFERVSAIAQAIETHGPDVAAAYVDNLVSRNVLDFPRFGHLAHF